MKDESTGLPPGFQRLFAFVFLFQLPIAVFMITVYMTSDDDAEIREQMPQIAFSVLAIMYFAITLLIAEVPARIPMLAAHGFKADRLARLMFRSAAVAWLVVALGNALLVQFA